MAHKLSPRQIEIILSAVKQSLNCASEEDTFVKASKACNMPEGAEVARGEYRRFREINRSKLPPYIPGYHVEHIGPLPDLS